MSNKHAYGTKEYYQEEIKRAELSKILVNEAVANRLKEGLIRSHEMEGYLEVMKEAERNVAYSVGQLEACECKDIENAGTN